MKERPSLSAFAECCALLLKQPRTVREIGDLMDKERGRVGDWIIVLKAEGLIYISGWQKTNGRDAAVYAWQPSICCYEDAPNQSEIDAAKRDEAIVERQRAGETAKDIALSMGLHPSTVQRAAAKRGNPFNRSRRFA